MPINDENKAQQWTYTVDNTIFTITAEMGFKSVDLKNTGASAGTFQGSRTVNEIPSMALSLPASESVTIVCSNGLNISGLVIDATGTTIDIIGSV